MALNRPLIFPSGSYHSTPEAVREIEIGGLSPRLVDWVNSLFRNGKPEWANYDP